MPNRPTLATAAALAAATALVLPTAAVAESSTGTEGLRAGTLAVQDHLQELQNIAESHGGNRASGTPGYQASLDYIKGQLDQAGFTTTVQEFPSLGGTGKNLVAETPGGDANQVVMFGAHLDSVGDGPGINDNGTGSAAILQAALDYAAGGETPTNKVRFAFWGAEEEGLVGSTHYVESLTEAERGKIAAYLNFDMVGSPNAGYFTYDGDDSDGVGAGPGPEGSAQIEQLLNDSLSAAGAPAEGTDFDGRSDYGPFIEVGIPAGGTFTGAEQSKTPEQAEKWGGQAGEAFDPCYHQSCDTLDNVDTQALERNFAAITNAVKAYAAQFPQP
ncbi:M20/M25/M40 family metallo-hydrolase [Saccharopolyspora rhizosphaerae]|uniref:M20/M25/M40 family metallo-hydrolase n=1 Tax=Saccharopolyspora rhizosphaerae TaxID=2492662 RepID=A0A3R8QDW2_9PSEU|nr:M28 family metallopeptidase [Saccharopolyspora rhizosphaerae]RRO18750.1 M20/M25/M40 family metallo-hydrolase [Saccharopolyspora rhizosphaerae]